jgi:phenylacetate-CoA ligase
MFIHPSQVAQVLKRYPAISKARLVVSGAMGNDEMVLHCEVEQPDAAASLSAAVVDSIRDVTKLRGEVRFVTLGSLPNDGKVIDDTRKYE